MSPRRARWGGTGSHLSDILVSDSADLLDIGGALGDVLQRVAEQDELVLLVLGDLDIDTLGHRHPSDNLLANEVSDLNLPQAGLLVLVEVDVDGEMGVDVAHLVLEAFRDTDDQVVDERANGSEGGDILASAVMDLNGDGVLLGVAEVDSQVAQILDQLACIPSVRDVHRQIAIGHGWFVPRGPSTVTTRVLMLTLTTRTGQSALSFSIVHRVCRLEKVSVPIGPPKDSCSLAGVAAVGGTHDFRAGAYRRGG